LRDVGEEDVVSKGDDDGGEYRTRAGVLVGRLDVEHSRFGLDFIMFVFHKTLRGGCRLLPQPVGVSVQPLLIRAVCQAFKREDLAIREQHGKNHDLIVTTCLARSWDC
jgi:hypothetical protein